MPDGLGAIDGVAEHLASVRDYLLGHPASWTELRELVERAARQPLAPYVVLPLAGAAAAGGQPSDAIPVAAAWTVLNEAMRILDDLQDRDHPSALHVTVGDQRAFNFAAALYAHALVLLDGAPWSDRIHRTVTGIFSRLAVEVAHGQDRDLRGLAGGLAGHWQTIAGKNGRAFALPVAAGAAATGAPADVVERCSTFGHHLGVVLQIFDDIEGVWGQGARDLELGRPGLPLAFGLAAEHPGREELRALHASGRLAAEPDRARALLDGADTRPTLLCAALDERSQALAALAECPDREAAAVLAAYVTAPFADLLEVAGLRAGDEPPATSRIDR